jgi:hypothetical protein
LTGEGAIAIYREQSGAGALDATIQTDLSYDTVVVESDTDTIEKNGGSPYGSFQLKRAGYYVVLYNLSSEDNAGALRSEIVTKLKVAGTTTVYGQSQTYIRRSEACDQGYNHGGTVIYVPVSSTLVATYQRTDSNAGGNTKERSNMSSISIVYLGDNLEVCRILMDSSVQTTTTAWVGVNWDDQDEVNTDAFAHDDTSDMDEITLKRERLYLVLVNTGWQNVTAVRGHVHVRATLAGTPLEHSYGSTYTRGTVDSVQNGVAVQMFLVDNQVADQILTIQVKHEVTSHSVATSRSGFAAICLPPTARAILLHDTAGGTSCDTAGTEIPFDTEDREDPAFDHDTGAATDDVIMKREGGDYLFLADVRNTRAAGVNRYNNLIEWRDGTTAYTRGSFGMHNRGTSTFKSATAGGIVLYNVSADDLVDLYLQDESSSAGTEPLLMADGTGLCGLHLDSIWEYTGRKIDGGLVNTGNVGGRLIA